MAVDTAVKRYAAMEFGSPTVNPGMPLPSGTVNQPHSLWLFVSGIGVLTGARRNLARRGTSTRKSTKWKASA